jgi:hypothetical protein
MSVTRDGGPAFPRPIGHNGRQNYEDSEVSNEQEGMSLRQYFARDAMSSLMQINTYLGYRDLKPLVIAAQAYEFADAMVLMSSFPLADDHVRGAAPDLLAALRFILAEPYGCPFCDSGKLRDPEKGHADNCGYASARYAIAKAEGRTES